MILIAKQVKIKMQYLAPGTHEAKNCKALFRELARLNGTVNKPRIPQLTDYNTIARFNSGELILY